MIIQISEPSDFPSAAVSLLSTHGEVHLGEVPADTEAAVEAVFVRLARRIGPEFHQRYPNLRYIVTPTTGLDHIDCAHFARHGVAVLSLKGHVAFLRTIRATVEHTLALVLALYRQLPDAAGAVRAGAWDRYAFKGHELAGKTVCILGHGRIGSETAKLFAAFGCRVLATDTVPDRVPGTMTMAWPGGLGEVDILSVHLPLETDTVRFVDGPLLDLLPAHAVVVNTARGEIVDQEALLSRIEGGRLAGAALDVLTGEPAPLDAALLRRIAGLGSRLVITPHIGGFTGESLDRVEIYMAEQLIQALDAAG